MKILVLNGGSSTLKATLRELRDGELPIDPPSPLWDASADWGRRPGKAAIRVRAAGRTVEQEIGIQSHTEVLRPVIENALEGRRAGGRNEAAAMKILVLNGGSSTLKATLRELPDGSLPADPPPPLWDASADWGRHPGKAAIRVRAAGRTVEQEIGIQSHTEVLRPVIEMLWKGEVRVAGMRPRP